MIKHRLTRSRKERYIFWFLGVMFVALAFAAWIIPNSDVMEAGEFKEECTRGNIKDGDDVKLKGSFGFLIRKDIIMQRLNMSDSDVVHDEFYRSFSAVNIYVKPPDGVEYDLGEKGILYCKLVLSSLGPNSTSGAFFVEASRFIEMPGEQGNILYGNAGMIMVVIGSMTLIYGSVNSALSARDLARGGGKLGFEVRSDDDVKRLVDQYTGMRLVQFLLFPGGILGSMALAGPFIDRFTPGYEVESVLSYVTVPFIFLCTILIISLCIALESPKILIRGAVERYVKENEIFNRQVQEELGRMKIFTGDSGAGGPICPACGYSLKSGWVACPQCGTAVGNKCSSCGEVMKSDWKKCPSCGESVNVRPDNNGRLGPGRRYKRLRAGLAEPGGGEPRSPTGREDWDDVEKF